MTNLYKIVEYVVIFEFLLVFALVLISYLMKLFYVFRAKQAAETTEKVANYFAKMIPGEAPIPLRSLPKRWKQIDIILPIVLQFAKLIDDASWQDKRMQTIRSIILPIARKNAQATDWDLRFYAAETFSLISDPEDEKIIQTLVTDPVRLVYISAAKAAWAAKSETSLNIIITRMSQEPRITQTFYLQAFDNVTPVTRPIIIKRLLSASNEEVRATCYRILLKYPPEPITWDVSADLASPNVLLKIIVMRVLTYTQDPMSIAVLQEAIKDKHPEVKAVAIHCINTLQDKSLIPDIVPCLADSEHWVRFIAIQALANLGEEGEKELQSRNLKADPVMVNATQYVLNTL